MAEDIARLREDEQEWLAEAERWTQNYADYRGVVGWRIRNLAERLAEERDRLDAAEAALGKVRALAEELTQEAQRQSKAHNVETAAGLWRASDLLAAALASTQREER